MSQHQISLYLKLILVLLCYLSQLLWTLFLFVQTHDFVMISKKKISQSQCVVAPPLLFAAVTFRVSCEDG